MIRRISDAMVYCVLPCVSEDGRKGWVVVRNGTVLITGGAVYVEIDDAAKDCNRMNARLAIAAMREPTDDMLGAVPFITLSVGSIGKWWRVMIDEALK